MNWVDLIIVLVIAFFIFEGWGKSFLVEALDLAGFILSFFLSLKFYYLATKQLEALFTIPHSLANVLGFIAIWYLVETLLFIATRIIVKGLDLSKISLPEKILSLIPAFLKGLVFVAIVLVLVATFPIQPRIQQDTQKSKIGPAILAKIYYLESPMKNIFGEVALETLTFLTVNPQTQEKIKLGFQNNNFSYDENLESNMVNLVNQERIKVGLLPLILDYNLRKIARNHSADMFQKGYFAHQSPEEKDVSDRAKEINYIFQVIGENLAYAPTLDLAHKGLMNSPGHRANILGEDYKKIGIGIAKSEEYGLMITQNFSN